MPSRTPSRFEPRVVVGGVDYDAVLLVGPGRGARRRHADQVPATTLLIIAGED